MENARVIVLLAAFAGALAAVASADWKGDLAAKTLGRVAREGLEDAMRAAALAGGLDAVRSIKSGR